MPDTRCATRSFDAVDDLELSLLMDGFRDAARRVGAEVVAEGHQLVRTRSGMAYTGSATVRGGAAQLARLGFTRDETAAAARSSRSVSGCGGRGPLQASCSASM